MFGYRKEPGQLTIRMRSHTASRIANMSDVASAWLEWTRRLQAIAQSGLTYAKDPYDVERYEQVRQIAAEIAASHTEAPVDRIDDLFSRVKIQATIAGELSAQGESVTTRVLDVGTGSGVLAIMAAAFGW